MLDFAPDFSREVGACQAKFELAASVLYGFLALCKTVEDFANDHLTIGVAKVGFGADQYSVPVLLSLKHVD